MSKALTPGTTKVTRRAGFLYQVCLAIALGWLWQACETTPAQKAEQAQPLIWDTATARKPVVITDTVPNDTDDPAIWLHPTDPSKSLIIGTDKDENGGLYVFGLDGKMQPEKCVKGLKRPNNVDILQGARFGTQILDIAVTTERLEHRIRIFSLPDMKPIDGGGIPMFIDDTAADFRDLMGVALYMRPTDGQVYAIVGRKNGPTNGTYLSQVALTMEPKGTITGKEIRRFGAYSGKKEIEAIAVDQQLGYVYYSDESAGIRKYHANPDSGNAELAFFGTEGFANDHEGISIYQLNDQEGYLLVSDQQRNCFHVFPREGQPGKPHDHPLLKVVKLSTDESDGSETTSTSIPGRFPHGFLVAMSTNKTFEIYRWEDLADSTLRKK